LKLWWPRFIVRPQVRLARPHFRAPTRPPDIVLFGVIFIVVLFVLGGNIYTLVKTPPPIAGGPNGEPILVAKGLDIQLGMEGLVASVVIFMGTIGLGLLYYSSKYVFQPGYAIRLMVLGAVLASVAYLIMTYLLGLKLYTS